MGNPINQTENSVNQTPKELGKELFEGKGMCATCHKADQKIVGPSIKDISKIYTEKGASIADFINDKGEPLVDPSQYEIMKANFVITKAMSADERKALEIYMMSFE
jgi:cytochrome c